jgi:hypothetical protein
VLLVVAQPVEVVALRVGNFELEQLVAQVVVDPVVERVVAVVFSLDHKGL